MDPINSDTRLPRNQTQSPSPSALAQTEMKPADSGMTRESLKFEETAAAVQKNIQLRGAASAEEQSLSTDVKRMQIAKVCRA